MLDQTHTLVWIDHRIAKVFRFDKDSNSVALVHSTHPHQHLHHKANSGNSGHAPVDSDFLDSVAGAIAHHGPILIVGPGGAKKELYSHLLDGHRDLAGRISDVKSVDHPTDGELLAYGRRFYAADDRMHGQTAS